jgi:Mrp family chromosome partitioning ATPase
MVHPGTGSRVITLIAAKHREGTSTVALEFARASREVVGGRVLLLDATARTTVLAEAPRTLMEALHNGLPPDLAIARGEEDVDRSVLREQGERHLMLGQAPGADEPWSSLRELYDLVVIDAPSLEESHLGLMLARVSDAAIVVVQAERTPRASVHHLIDLLHQTGAQVAGTIMNRRRRYVPDFILNRV